MNRNVEDHFGQQPSKNIRRSKFKRDCSLKTTFNTGDIVPIYVDEVLPGDTVKLNCASLVRMSTPINPTMDNAWMDLYWFFIPRRLTWEHWAEFMGENKTDAWTETNEYTIPIVKPPENGWIKGSLGEKIYGVQGVDNYEVDAQYLRSYVCVFNEWFRNQNVTEPAEMSTGDADTAGSNGTNYVTDLQKGGMPAKAVKYADYFTRALPSPQKGPDIYIPIQNPSITINGQGSRPLRIKATTDMWDAKVDSDNTSPFVNADEKYPIIYKPFNETDLKFGGVTTNSTTELFEGTEIPDGQYAQFHTWVTGLTGTATDLLAPTVTQLRQAFAIQRMYEIDARGGTRYIEILAAHFGVQSPDGRLQRPEYLGGKRIPINITQVLQTSSTDATSPQGNTAAMSLTIDNHDMFTKSFVEHGILMGLAVVRTEHTYQQGINRIFSRKNRIDFYWPELANLSEQYIKNKEIFVQGSDVVDPESGNPYDEEAFGYQEAWAEYRYGINKITGELNSNYSTPLDSWHYGDDYSTMPVLSDAWIRETDTNVARTLAITTQDQFIADFYFDQTWTRPMPIYSIPSLTGWN